VPICSYVVFPAPGRTDVLARTLGDFEGCTVEVAENREMLLLVTETSSPEADRVLRTRVEAEPDIEALVLAFGEIDPETEEGDPVAGAREAERAGLRLPVLDAHGPEEMR
jgi:nitrate reductase NapAB chaperone NapD